MKTATAIKNEKHLMDIDGVLNQLLIPLEEGNPIQPNSIYHGALKVYVQQRMNQQDSHLELFRDALIELWPHGEGNYMKEFIVGAIDNMICVIMSRQMDAQYRVTFDKSRPLLFITSSTHHLSVSAGVTPYYADFILQALVKSGLRLDTNYVFKP